MAGRSLASSTSVPGPRALPITLRLPLAYLHILGTEATRAGLKRGQFLQLLLQRKLGGVTVARSTEAPVYDGFGTKDLTTTKLWIWYATPKVRQLLDEDRLQMGLSSIGSWVTQTLNQWIGRPEGLRRPPRS
jgi:hypothetical protein